jgi:class 3 adenylate cyclase/tetratricopeptide (TPR) repeat protein
MDSNASETSKAELPIPETAIKDAIPVHKPLEGERKHVTVLFSDLTGYTAMSERLDPEEVKEITTHIFGEISKIVNNYEGFIEKYAGDAVMALFGADTSHEDDPVRAISAAREIHNIVNSLSPKYEERIEQPLSMHSGINTGLVVTGEVNLEKGTHGVAGDTINVAARLSALGNAGDILVTSDTYLQAQGYFNFKELEPASIKGKSEPVRVFKFVAQKDQPVKVHRLQGLRAELIGRSVEMSQLTDAVQMLKQGRGSVISICGTAGTGKSRLVAEFKEALNLEEIQWLEGHAYSYSKNIPYFPLIDLLGKALQIEEDEPQETVREKVANGVSALIGDGDNAIAYIGSLFSLDYPEIENVSPEFWKTQLQRSVQATLTALGHRAPTIVCLEDLHWSDPSFLELIRILLLDHREPILFLCVYRPQISVFSDQQINTMANPYTEIRLQDLSPSESRAMVESLLQTGVIPTELQQFIHDKIEGNPFYIEEIINSLIESQTLVRDNGGWKATRAITESDVSSTIHGVIAGRIDRLEKETKRILQEASVIGRAFLYDILKRISQIEKHIDRHLSGLERLDLIKTRAFHPDLEYIFKHALTQEVVYNGLLKKERRKIHDRIGHMMEQLFHDRLPEFYETLAFHFKHGESIHKAVDYLMKAGEKSLKRYALEESHQYYNEAFVLLSEMSGKTESDRELLIDLLMKWAMVFYYRGAYREMDDLLEQHKEMAASLEDQSRFGMFHAWHGFIIFCRNRVKDAYEYLTQALQIGERLQDDRLIGYACTWLPWICFYFGRLDEAIAFGQRAQAISKRYPSDQYLYFKSLGGIGCTYYWKGEKKKVFQIGKELVDFGRRKANIRSQSMGQAIIGFAYALEGNITEAIGNVKKAIHIAADPFYKEYERTFLAAFFALNGQMEDTQHACKQIFEFHELVGVELAEAVTKTTAGVAQIAAGQMDAGLNMLKAGRQELLEGEAITAYCLCEYIMGKVYLQMTAKTEPLGFLTFAKNIGFIVKNVPFAAQKAEKHFEKAIELGQKIGAKSISGPAYLDMGLLFQYKKKDDRAIECITKAVKIFEECEAEVYLKQAREALESLS